MAYPVYKEKPCQKCGKLCRKQGPYCSKVCSNAARIWSPESIKKLSRNRLQYYDTPEGLAKKSLVSKQLTGNGLLANIIPQEDYTISIPSMASVDDYTELDGFDRAEDW